MRRCSIWLVSLVACSGEPTAAPPGPAPRAARPTLEAKAATPAPPADDAAVRGAYAEALEAVAASVERSLDTTRPAEIADYEQGVAVLRQITPGAHMGRISDTLTAKGLSSQQVVDWMQAHRAEADELAQAMEARLAKRQGEVRAVMERVAELAPPQDKARIEKQLAALDDAAAPPSDDASAPPWRVLQTLDDLAEVAAKAGAEQGVVIDVAAQWCMPCKELERVAFADPAAAAELAVFERVKIDVTEPGPANETIIERLGAQSLPNVLVFRSGAALAEQLAAPKPVQPDARVTSSVSGAELAATLAGVRSGA